MLKNITFSAEEATIKAAREYAALHGKTLNVLVREILEGYAQKKQQEEGKERVTAFRELQKTIQFSFEGGLMPNREERNERRPS